MGVGRGLRQIVLPLQAVDDVPGAVTQIRRRGRAALREQRMWIRVRDDGRVQVMMGGGPGFHVMPTARGVLRAVPDRGLVLDAVLRESWLEVIRSALCLAGSVILAALALGFIVLGAFLTPYLYISVLGAVLLGDTGRTMRRRRADIFNDGADEVARRLGVVLLPQE